MLVIMCKKSTLFTIFSQFYGFDVSLINEKEEIKKRYSKNSNKCCMYFWFWKLIIWKSWQPAKIVTSLWRHQPASAMGAQTPRQAIWRHRPPAVFISVHKSPFFRNSCVTFYYFFLGCSFLFLKRFARFF